MKRSRRTSSIPAAFQPHEPSEAGTPSLSNPHAVGGVRIIGGTLRGRTLPFGADPHVRPMKDRVREAVFNLLADDVKGRQVIDLFAGTGVLGFEAISRGASRALLLERHFPTAKAIRRHAEALEIGDRMEVVAADTFVWVRRLVDGLLMGPDGRPLDMLVQLTQLPWLVFCCPPYVLYAQRCDEMLQLIVQLIQLAPPGSQFVVESDERFDPGMLLDADQWLVRQYPPATIAMRRFP
ncbi:MAG: RsmD family RNA methyltransferase [Pirellulales bacterium]